MATSAIRSRFWRGGVCNALIFRRADLPADQSTWQKLFANAMGSPDPYGRQLNGMGGEVSSLSKICIVSPSTREDADVDFEFVQIVIEDGALDLASNCGNMTAAIGPFALDEKLFSPSATQLSKQPGHTTVRIFNTNTKKVIASTFPTHGQPPRFQPHGAYKMDGVPGTGSKISLSFLSPGGTQTGAVFPTGNGITSMATTGKNGGHVQASLVDVANPVVYVDGTSLGISPDVTPADLDQKTGTMISLESIRREAASLMGMNPDVASVPKLVILFPPQDTDVNITCMALSMGQAHKAIPLTLALNLAVACRFEGNLASELVKGVGGDGKITIQHPSGTITVGTEIRGENVESATIYSTARLLMSGEVNID
ncbi:hypothetical protein Neosp_009525 [[Neocosmospora] mangrovei]